jgi:acylphosphatase
MGARRVTYEGRVQGVGFRYTVRQLATGYDVIGWIENLIDGRVQMAVQGEAGEVDEFLKSICDSHLRGYIDRVIIDDIPPLTGLKGFQIRH